MTNSTNLLIRFNRVALLVIPALLGSAFSLSAADASRPGEPNVLFIMSDDHTSQAIGAYGSRLAVLNPTPNIDSLAEGGMRFDRVFCNNSICTPSRASIITGQYSQTNGVLDLTGNIPPERQYLAIEMGKAGYHTAMIGRRPPVGWDHCPVRMADGSTAFRSGQCTQATAIVPTYSVGSKFHPVSIHFGFIQRNHVLRGIPAV